MNRANTTPFLFSPMAGNPFASREDAAAALRALAAPLSAHFSEGRGRLRLGSAGAHFPEAAADLEGLTRPFWGLAPLIAGGGSFPDIGLYVEGLANGSNPDHPDYWGPAADFDQRIVESAAIGFALRLAPEVFWDGLGAKGRDTLARWLVATLNCRPAPNNWHFFHVLVALGLDRVGVAYDRAIIERDLDHLESLDIGNGWYRDGPGRRAEHYIPFAMHFYGLIHAAWSEGHGAADAARAERFRERARAFAPQIRHWYASDGAALPYGRSLTYRFAHAGFWGGLALADVEALPWSDIRGYWARNLRWWSSVPMADRDGILPVGYGYPNLLMSESYNSPGSPYWAFKAFAPLALPATHPFWTAAEADYVDQGPATLRQPGMVKFEEPGNVTVLTGGQEAPWMRAAPEKYSKFAYSTRYGFSVENDARSFPDGPFDNALAFSLDGAHYAVRTTETQARIAEDMLYSEWSPLPGVAVESWTIARAPWHLRIHKVTTSTRVQTREGGFAIARHDFAPELAEPPMPGRGEARPDTGPRHALVGNGSDISQIVDLGACVRAGRVLAAAPNTNVIFPRSFVPQLSVTLDPGTHWLAAAVVARPAISGDPGPVPALPEMDELEQLRDASAPIPVWQQ